MSTEIPALLSDGELNDELDELSAAGKDDTKRFQALYVEWEERHGQADD